MRIRIRWGERLRSPVLLSLRALEWAVIGWTVWGKYFGWPWSKRLAAIAATAVLSDALLWLAITLARRYAAALGANPHVVEDVPRRAPQEIDSALQLWQDVKQESLRSRAGILATGGGAGKGSHLESMLVDSQSEKDQQTQQQHMQQQGDYDPALTNWASRAPLAAITPVVTNQERPFDAQPLQAAHSAMPSPPNLVRLFYGTDRARKISSRDSIGYSWRRGRDLDYGVCWVSIPSGERHSIGRLESPSWFRLEAGFDRERHVTLRTVAPVARELWLEHIEWLRNEVGTPQMLLFVHGYNVTFQDAARRTAQFVYDLGFSGIPMFYSWPSCGSTFLYTFDEAAVQSAESHLQTFILDSLRAGNFDSVYLIAHSMGNRVMTAALERVIRKTAALGTTIRHIILAAPDIDASYFKTTIAPNLMELGLKMTMYVSSRDRALAASRWFHGWPRVGDAKKGIVVLPGMDTIDASNVDTSFMGHSVFAARRELIGDIHYLIKGDRAPDRYGLETVQTPESTYYRFKK